MTLAGGSMVGATVDAYSQNDTQLRVIVGAVSNIAEGIRTFELWAVDGSLLPAFSSGAHIDVWVPGGLIRQYSLCNPPQERDRYVIAVLREEAGRGGSLAMHEQVVPGTELIISAPRNLFSLHASAKQHLFIAGGIGITPIMAMLHEVRGRGEPYRLYYCSRSPERTAFLDQLLPLTRTEPVCLHHDGGDPARGLDLVELLRDRPAGCHLYYCGPGPFMDAIAAAAAHWPEEAVHYEHFSAAADSAVPVQDQVPFAVELARTGERFEIAVGETIVEVLSRNGIPIDVSCQEGYCGTCMTRYVDGNPQHHDTVLDADDRSRYVMLCCARADGGTLVLDL